MLSRLCTKKKEAGCLTRLIAPILDKKAAEEAASSTGYGEGRMQRRSRRARVDMSTGRGAIPGFVDAKGE